MKERRRGQKVLRHQHLQYWLQNLIWVWLGGAVAFGGIRFLLEPAVVRETPVGHHLSSHLDYVWNGCWILGGVFMLIGVLARMPRTEMLGHWFFNAGIVPDVIAVGLAIGVGPNFWILTGLGAGSLGRLAYLIRITPKRHQIS